MKTERNTLTPMSKNQLSPGLCDPRDFEVIEAGVPFNGNCGNTEAEYKKLLRDGERNANASDFAAAEEHPNVNDALKSHTPAD
jgi:hypothetical protein